MSDDIPNIDPQIPIEIDKLLKGKESEHWEQVRSNVQTLRILQSISNGKYTVALVEYEKKLEILVFECSNEDLRNNPFIEVDFTFSNHMMPIAKFPPVSTGWEDACNYVKFISRSQ